jgi:hypothetical protein
VQLFRDPCRLDPLAPEKRGSTELAELLERAAGLLQQLMIRALRGQALDFVIDDAQIGRQTVESSANVPDLGQ